MSEANKAVVRRYVEDFLNRDNFALADQLFSADSVFRGPDSPELRGREARKQYFASLRNSFPDLRFTVDELIAEGDKVVMRWSNNATHRGAFWGIAPTGKKVGISGITILRVANGMITDEFVQSDALGFMRQLGVVPALAQTAGVAR